MITELTVNSRNTRQLKFNKNITFAWKLLKRNWYFHLQNFKSCSSRMTNYNFLKQFYEFNLFLQESIKIIYILHELPESSTKWIFNLQKAIFVESCNVERFSFRTEWKSIFVQKERLNSIFLSWNKSFDIVSKELTNWVNANYFSSQIWFQRLDCSTIMKTSNSSSIFT